MIPPALTGAADAAASSLVAAAWESVVLVFGIALCLHLLRGLGAAARSVVWTGVLVLVMLLPALPWVLTEHGASSHDSVAAVQVSEAWGVSLVCLWSLLSMVRALMLVRSAMRLRSVLQRATPVDADVACRAILTASSRPAELCLSADVDRPSVAGFFRPRVLVPAALYERVPPAELQQILRHEMEHVRRRDDWVNLLQKLSVVLFPLNPVLIWLDARLSLERELACDDGVLRQTRARKAYAACLANLAATATVRRGASLALGAWGRQTELARRIHRILAWTESGLSRQSAVAVTTLLLASITAGTAVLARSPQLVSFAPRVTVSHDSTAASQPPGISAASRVPVSQLAHPVLVQAVMPVKVSVPLTPATLRRSHTRRKARVVKAAMNRATPQPTRRMPAPWVMLTDWGAGHVPAHLTLAVAERDVVADQSTPATDGQPSEEPRYAAVATSEGWLIFQL